MASGVGWGQGNDPDNPADRAAAFTGGSGQQISVAGTARIKDKSVNRTAVSKDGTRTSGFFLNYVAADDKFAFSRVTTDSDTATPVRALANTTAVAGKWTHLTGIYDTASGKMKLYVNGVLQTTTTATGGWNATGGYVIGRAKWAGAATNIWDGEIDDVRIYGKALTDDQVATLAGDENPGRLLRVRRAALQQGSKTATDGEIATNVVYNVPLTQAAGGPYNLGPASIATWGQVDLPTDATAVFGPENNPGRNRATPTAPGTSGYPYATVHYLSAGGKEVNTATPGGHIDTQEYDRFGNVIRTLDATDRALALGTLPNAATYLAELGLAGSDTAARALALSTTNTYSSDGTDLLETLGPTITLVLENDLADPDGAGPLEGLPAGSTVIGRAHKVSKYDEGKPDGASYHLVTTERQGAQVDGYPDADVRVTTYGYDPHSGGVSGWTLGKFTTMVADAGAGGANLTARGVYDAAGRSLKSWGIDSTGSDARARVNIYYTAGPNSQDAACGNHPEWAGLACVGRAAGVITGHDPARMTGELPARRVTRYSRYQKAEEVVETAGGVTRTTTTTYDAASRVTVTAVTSDEGTPLEAVNTTYDPATGQLAQTTRGGATIFREYDALGRLVRYTDSGGATTTSEYNRFGRQVKVSDPTGWSTYAYDRAIEPRGLLTSVTDSVTGTFTAAYSPDEQLVELKYPGGLTRTDRLNANQQPVERIYTRDSDGEIVYSESVVENSAGQWVNHTYTGGSKVYSYDRLGRLKKTQHDTPVTAGCVTRTYSYDTRTNRTNRSVFDPAADGACNTDGVGTQDAHSYDSADRITDPGYRYDAFGRTTQLPDGLTNSYYANDLVRRQTLDDARQTWTLDPADRIAAFTTETLMDGQWTPSVSRRQHYGDDTDEPRWTVEDTTENRITRFVSGPDGDLTATTSGDGIQLLLTNLHGDVAATIDPALTEPELYDYDEFGAPIEGQAAQRYGWLGGKQRSGEALGGLILMGVRLYNPALGRFLQMDPQDGGNANAYDYCSADPVNCSDLDGRFWGRLKKAVKGAANFVKNNPALVCSTIAMFTPPPVNAIAGGLAIGFSLYSAAQNARERKWGAMALDLVGAIPGAGGLARGVRAGRAFRGAKQVGKTIPKFKGFRGARKMKRKVLNKMHHKVSDAKRHRWYQARWDRWDRRAAYPAAAAYTACKYVSSCANSRVSRWARLY
ncbi:LamG-like jellyroll fold domain-containing protein [Micromonospora sp. SL1-18]|uniref:LamG-like jellyroll fold domain-containing protein n=1 Tax=Micromonospora sp. SL1-18 TaxID=3399128 RepID=UPI003A4D29D3